MVRNGYEVLYLTTEEPAWQSSCSRLLSGPNDRFDGSLSESWFSAFEQNFRK